ncbi:MAG: hypothetical protein AAFQ42_02480 [Pseudomonadota bacterium]
MGRIFTGWKEQSSRLFGQHTVVEEHSLATSPLFSDDWLADLIEAAPPATYHVNTMDPETHDPRTRREGTIEGLSGAEVIDAIKRGTIWILLQNPGDTNPAYAELLTEIYEELHSRVPGLATYKQKMSLLISSPRVQVYYHCDVPGQTLWQLRGRKRVFIYPNRPPFLPQAALEKIVLGEAHEISLEYETWYDDYAQVVDLEPGHMAHWPLNCPHRIVNQDCLNVSFTTEHWTDALRDTYAINYANGIIRKGLEQRLGLGSDRVALSQASTGLAKWSKMGVAAAAKYSGAQAKRKATFHIDFEVDPTMPHSVRDIDGYDLAK